MKVVGVYEAKTNFTELIREVQSGEIVTVTKHGHPIAKIAPINEVQPVEDAIAQLKKLRESMRLDGLSVQVLREEGRR
ncbi:MAG: type II toxin-antitoxin system prevent-host-death family antitoxin [Acaryochloridaceae cyanobacterium RU_4_10]|nr:type II toxin-antitoxin system prevent-host-death family antitoxin [Acaryochloridaceae cyanobacterium RU_4_10]